MKSYNIGRDESCDVVINDPSQVVSRHHATLQVDGRKMTITDNSSNGTYINGIKITPGTPVPLTRSDVVSFAQAAELDWKQIPNTSLRTMWVILAVVLVAAAAGVGGWLFLKNDRQKKIQEQNQVEMARVQLQERVDTLAAKTVRILSAVKAAQGTLEELNALCQTKDPSKLSDVNKVIGQLEEKMSGIDTEALSKSMDSIRQSLEDGSARTAQRVAEMEGMAEGYEKTLEAVAGLSSQARTLLDAIPDAKAVKKAKTTPQPDEQKQEEEAPAARIF